MLLSKINLKPKIGLFSQFSNFACKNLMNTVAFNFSRLNKPLNKFVHIYPNDNVVVLPAFMKLKNLSSFDRRIVQSNKKYENLSKMQYGRVIRIYRKRNIAIVSGVNRKEEFKHPREYLPLVERGDLQKVRRKITYTPVNLSRLRLRDMKSEEIKPLNVKIRTNSEGIIERYAPSSDSVIEKPDLSKTYASRVEKKKTGPKDTSSLQVLDRTYTGVDYTSVAREFLNRIKEKKTIESNLIFMDK
jgi:hypothetical protein